MPYAIYEKTSLAEINQLEQDGWVISEFFSYFYKDEEYEPNTDWGFKEGDPVVTVMMYKPWKDMLLAEQTRWRDGIGA